MIAFCKAITDRWAQAMPAGLPLYDEDGAPVGTPLPYAQFSIPAGMPEHAFEGLSYETLLVQFDLYAKKRVEAWAYFEALKAAFDDCRLPVVGYDFMSMEREPWHRFFQKGAWHFVVPYTVQLQPL